ncbi:MAG TPA: hypothetical protein VE991_11965, partial [Acidimicrobiales bacterium]|nr:hypothetical protein [Acidimicrobiales bacterium]
MRFRRRAAWGASSIGIVALAVMAWGGVSLAASGGGYNPDQNDCPWNSGAWNTPPNTVTPGCHNFAANVETGNTTNGDPNSNNTRFAEFGIDELPNNPGNPSFGFEENVGDPGTPDSPHSGCLAANTDGTGGGTGVGCGDNPNGAGFSSTWDYYFIYCPVMAALPVGSTPDAVGTATMGAVTGPALYQCSEPYAQPTLTVDKGTQTALDQILTQGLLVYIGAVDNLDNGEHDGFSGNNNTDGALNGSSDGGGAVLSLTPQSAADSPTAAHPEGLLNASEGECADSICFEATTQQQTVYYGCTTSTSSGAYNGTSGANSPQNNAADDQCTTSQQSTNAY